MAKSKISLREAAETKNICLEIKNGELRLKENHNYYYQIQGQLNIAKREFCYFVVYVDDNTDLYVEIIQKNETLWQNEMLPQLVQFYNDCILQEIVRRRVPRGQNCYDPPYIIKAQNALKNKKKNKGD